MSRGLDEVLKIVGGVAFYVDLIWKNDWKYLNFPQFSFFGYKSNSLRYRVEIFREYAFHVYVACI